MNTAPFPLELIRPDLKVLAPLLIEKLKVYAELFDVMDEHGGWLPYPPHVIEHFREIGVRHWAELYSKDGQSTWAEAHTKQIVEVAEFITDGIGTDPTPDGVNAFVNSFLADVARTGLLPSQDGIGRDLRWFLDDLLKFDCEDLSETEKHTQRDTWIGYHVHFYNDLSLATHGESIFALVARALEGGDDDAMVMAIQVDRSLLPFFQNHFWDRALGGDANFWDSVSYRINNPPIRGRNKYPLLWILFKDLQSMRCLGKQIKNRDILNLYRKGVGAHSKYAIYDLLIVQRQRRRYLSLNAR